MNELQILDSKSILNKDFTIYGDIDNPLFLAKDVAEWIEHSNPSKMVRDSDLGENEVEKHILSTLTNSYTAIFLTEDGLYEVLMQSRKPIAKEFKKKVKEILKDIRKKGIYATDVTLDNMLNNPDFAITLLTNYKNEKEARAIAEAQLVVQAPKMEAFDKFIDTTNLMNWNTVAKSLGIGKINMLKIFREKGILQTDVKRYRGKAQSGINHNIPYERYMKYFEIKRDKDSEYNNVEVLTNAKGLEYLRKSLVKIEEERLIAKEIEDAIEINDTVKNIHIHKSR